MVVEEAWQIDEEYSWQVLNFLFLFLILLFLFLLFIHFWAYVCKNILVLYPLAEYHAVPIIIIKLYTVYILLSPQYERTYDRWLYLSHSYYLCKIKVSTRVCLYYLYKTRLIYLIGYGFWLAQLTHCVELKKYY